jgi:hypothetical protein
LEPQRDLRKSRAPVQSNFDKRDTFKRETCTRYSVRTGSFYRLNVQPLADDSVSVSFKRAFFLPAYRSKAVYGVVNGSGLKFGVFACLLKFLGVDMRT